MSLLKIGKPFTPSVVYNLEVTKGYEYVCKIGNKVFYEYTLKKEELNKDFIELDCQRGQITWNKECIASIRPVQIAYIEVLNVGNSNMTQPLNTVWNYGYVVEEGVEIIKEDGYSSLELGKNGLLAKLNNMEMSKLLK